MRVFGSLEGPTADADLPVVADGTCGKQYINISGPYKDRLGELVSIDNMILDNQSMFQKKIIPSSFCFVA